MIRRRALQATLGLLLLMPVAAQACPQPSFSCIPRYHFALDQQTGAGVTSLRGNGLVTTQVGFGVGVDFFPIENLSIGLQGGVAGHGEKPTGEFDYGRLYPVEHETVWTVAWRVGARVGYNIPFSRRWSVWPRAGLELDSTPRLSFLSGPAYASDPEFLVYRTLSVDLFAPVVVHPNRYFFVGFGPFLAVPVYARAANVENPLTETTFGLKLLLGGHF